MKTVLLNPLGEDICDWIEIWTTTTQTTLKLCRQLGAITGLCERKPMAFIDMPGTTKNTLNNVQEEFDTALKAEKKILVKHIWMIWDRYVGRILDTRFEVTRTKLNYVPFDMKMEIDLRDMEVVATFSFGEDIHDKIRTNECNKFGKNQGSVITQGGGESLNRPGRQRNRQNQLKQQGQGRKWKVEYMCRVVHQRRREGKRWMRLIQQQTCHKHQP